MNLSRSERVTRTFARASVCVGDQFQGLRELLAFAGFYVSRGAQKSFWGGSFYHRTFLEASTNGPAAGIRRQGKMF
jgi:hypothetical protein